MKLAELLDNGSKVFQKPYSHARFSIAVEIECIADTTKRELEHLTDLGLRIYKKIDYATPMGIGCAIGNYVMDGELDLLIIDYDELLAVYFNSDWS